MRWIIGILLYSLISPHTAWGSDITLRIGTHSIRAMIANTPDSRERGLMHYTYLCANCGMLFVFPQPGKHHFWMKGTTLPLSIAFIAADGRILNIAEMQANTTQTHSARGDAKYALEMNKGWFTEHAIKPDDRVQGLQQSPLGQ
jgi:uncharacterized protein